ncbi:hypothetical protein WL34_12625 [Burkholderia cepacia]|nr:hypothetical protein WL34_12625 [Burkholderia cepacia]
MRLVECHCGDGKRNRLILLSYYGISRGACDARSRCDAPRAARSGNRLPAGVVTTLRAEFQLSDMRCSLMA